jgi:hypothetical protein
MAGLTSARRWQLRRIFLQKRGSYSPKEAGRVLGLPRKEVVAMIDAHEVEAVTRVTHSLPWLSVAELALDHCTIADLIEALGKDAPAVIPALLYPSTPLHVTLPLYLSKLLQHLAATAETSVDAYLAMILRDIAEELNPARAQRAEEAIPGFEAALAFPDEPESLP